MNCRHRDYETVFAFSADAPLCPHLSAFAPYRPAFLNIAQTWPSDFRELLRAHEGACAEVEVRYCGSPNRPRVCPEKKDPLAVPPARGSQLPRTLNRLWSTRPGELPDLYRVHRRPRRSPRFEQRGCDNGVGFRGQGRIWASSLYPGPSPNKWHLWRQNITNDRG